MSDNKLSNNNLESELVENKPFFLKPITENWKKNSKKIVIFMVD